MADMLEAHDPSSAPAGDASVDSGALVPVTSSVTQPSSESLKHVARCASVVLQQYFSRRQ